MVSRPLNRVVCHLRCAARACDGMEGTDGQLLSQFVAARDETAFAALVGRHGPMVLGVCRRVLGNPHDAEDAFQATFLVLVKKAAGVLPRDRVGNWLYGVAYRTALEAKARRARRKAKEAQVNAGDQTADVLDVASAREQLGLLDRELARLPDRYRAAVVLCDLEGKTHREAARLLGCPEKTLSTRLLRARKRLAQRLAGAGGVPAAVCAAEAARAGLPAPLVQSTIRAALAVAAGQATTAVTSVRIAGLAEGVLKAMLLNRLKGLSLAILVASLLVSGAGLLLHSARAEKPAESRAASAPLAPEGKPVAADRGNLVPQLQALQWDLLEVDHRRRTLHVGDASAGAPIGLLFVCGACRLQVRGIPVAEDARVTINGKRAPFADLRAGMLVSLKFAERSRVVTRVVATAPPPVLQEVDAKKRTITVRLFPQGKPTVLPVAQNASVDLAHGGKVTLEDLKPGMHLSLEVELEDGRFVVKHLHVMN